VIRVMRFSWNRNANWLRSMFLGWCYLQVSPVCTPLLLVPSSPCKAPPILGIIYFWFAKDGPSWTPSQQFWRCGGSSLCFNVPLLFFWWPRFWFGPDPLFHLWCPSQLFFPHLRVLGWNLPSLMWRCGFLWGAWHLCHIPKTA